MKTAHDNEREPTPGREGLPMCRACHLPARLRDLHFLRFAREQGVAMLKQHILCELGKDTFERLGGDNHGVMQWLAGILRYEAWEKEAQRKGGLPHERSL